MAAQSCSYAMDQLPHEGVFRAAFEAQSLESSATHPRIKLIPGDEILRDDIIPCIERALDRKLDLPPRVILNCFNLDISGVISWEEFRQSLQAMKLMRPTAIASTVASGGMTSSTGSGGGTTRSHKRLMEARRKGRPFGPVPQVASDTPLTSAQEVGWQHGAAPVMPRGSARWGKYAPIKGTDVTRGGEGRNIQTYFGSHLG